MLYSGLNSVGADKITGTLGLTPMPRVAGHGAALLCRAALFIGDDFQQTIKWVCLSIITREKVIDVLRIDAQKWRWAGHSPKERQEKWSKIVTNWYPRDGNRNRGSLEVGPRDQTGVELHTIEYSGGI
ncbi:jg17870 [Pararge aegeria aegeria]|uniref:Jg17870 protein n=1 Tax=Pararge aegeria aegeria TaxID=348720 RepID=A0A8S4SP77_9NEOP|nr:jg17870 [Pararge aegeria aegeria]